MSKDKTTAAAAVKGFDEYFEKLGIDPSNFWSIHKEDDWSFVIKMHSLLEAAANSALAEKIDGGNDNGIFEAVSYLEMSNAKSGKVKFLKSLGLITKQEFLYLRSFSQLRNKVAHRVENINFCIAKYYMDCKGQEKKEFEFLDMRDCSSEILELAGLTQTEYDQIPQMSGDPKLTIFTGALSILASLAAEESKLREGAARRQLSDAILANLVKMSANLNSVTNKQESDAVENG